MTSQNGEYIRLCLRERLEEQGMTRYRLHRLTGIKYEIIDRYYKGTAVERVDLFLLAKMCGALGCQVEDLLKYERK